MPSKLMRVSVVAAVAVCLSAPPAHAGFKRALINALPFIVKRAAALIENEIYDAETTEEQQGYGEEQKGYDGSQARLGAEGSGRTQGNHSRTPRTALHAPTVAPLNYLPSGDSGSSFESATGQDFVHGAAGQYSYDQLVHEGVFVSCPLHGSIFTRKSPVKYIILHSTETASIADARRVVQSWNNRGMRHPGAQFVVDRDGTVCSTTNPDLATVHINTKKTLPGYTNDNSVGIEIVRAGKQQYTRPQLDSVMYLVSYLQAHYHVADSNITTHHHVQPSDRSDPVGFDLLAFENAKTTFRQQGLAYGPVPYNGTGYEPATQPAKTSYSNFGNSANGTRNSRVPSKSTQHVSFMPTAAPDFRKQHHNVAH
jgi:hypothetical protein